jgi:hypothetical protein
MTDIKVATISAINPYATYGYPFVPDPFDPRIQILPQGVKPPIVAFNESIRGSATMVTGPRIIVGENDWLYNDDYVGDNYFAQKDITKYLLYRILDKWLYEDKLSSILKLMKYENGKIRLVKNMKESEENKISNDSEEVLEKKADFLEENYLTMEKMKKILTKVTQIGGIRWYMLPYSENIVISTIKKYLKNKLSDGISDKKTKE